MPSALAISWCPTCSQPLPPLTPRFDQRVSAALDCVLLILDVATDLKRLLEEGVRR